MPLNAQISQIKHFIGNETSTLSQGMLRVTVVAFEDRCNLNCGMHFAELLKSNPLFEVKFFNEHFPKGFLNLQGRNFFDFIDRGAQILKSTQSDVVIWGYEENGKIRLNFQVSEQYKIPNELHFSLLESLFVPLNFFTNIDNFSPSLLDLINAVIIAAAPPVTGYQKSNKSKILAAQIAKLSAGSAPKDLSPEFMPYIMNMLGKVYLYNVKDNLSATDIAIISDLFNNALERLSYVHNPLCSGCTYANLAQLHELAFNRDIDNGFEHLKAAISFYQESRKYLNRNYPYDFGISAYHLALLYYEYWKHKNDIQGLRDAVARLREAERVYTFEQFPTSWCHIEGTLGYYLTSLGMSTASNEIMQLAINSYKLQQKIHTQYAYPSEWADVQKEIGNIYYLLGKQNNDDNFMYEARNYFNSAADIYAQIHDKKSRRETEIMLGKVRNYIG